LPSILFIHPPVAKACEPPGGIAALVGTMERAGVECGVLDLNLEGLDGLMRGEVAGEDVWTRLWSGPFRAVQAQASGFP